MRAVIQRVSKASVTINSNVTAHINTGFLVLLGIEQNDTSEDAVWLCKKIAQLRVFNDENGHMNRSLHDVQGDILLVSQFTLFASTKKGNRPSFIRAAQPQIAIPLYEACIHELQKHISGTVYTGEFGADMKIELCNDGPVTICIDSKNRE